MTPPPLTMLSIFLLASFGSANKIISLTDRKWNFTSSATPHKFAGVTTIPGGIFSDCTSNGLIDEYIFSDYNDEKYRWIGETDWDYSTSFELTHLDTKHQYISLVFHGVNTVASIFVNNQLIGFCNNMFVRHVFSIKSYIKEGPNSLTVRFNSSIKEGKRQAQSLPYTIPPECPLASYHGECHVNKLRTMQASFSWDWAPAFPSVGLWKPAELFLTMFPARLASVGAFVDPSKSSDSYWALCITLWFDILSHSQSDFEAFGWAMLFLEVENRRGISLNLPFILHSTGQKKLWMRVPKALVKLWWPRGYGQQPLYKLQVEVMSSYWNTIEKQKKCIHFGFRTVELVQEDIISGNQNAGLSFYLKINGVPVFAKGSNWVPLDIFPEESADDYRIAHLLRSSVDANFNMLRVWGGGLYESDLFYNMCDRLGIMVWQDMMFACSMYQADDMFLDSVRKEVTQQTQRLQYHPSLVFYSGNNENEAALSGNWYGTSRNFVKYKNDYIRLYVDTIEEVFQKVDPTRPYTLASPTNGVKSIEEGYVASNPQDPLYGDVHFYSPSTNGWDWRIYPTPRFASEYGVQSLPSYRILKTVLKPTELHWESDGIEWRQHSLGGNEAIKRNIMAYLPWSNDLRDIVYLSQINQAMWMKTETEHYRRFKNTLDDKHQGRTMGALFWQLNDVWEAITLSAIDYQGNWKMLQYFAKHFFSDVLIVPIETDSSELLVTVVSDVNRILKILVTTKLYTWDSFDDIIIRRDFITLEPLEATTVYQAMLSTLLLGRRRYDCFLAIETDMENTPGNVFFPENLLMANYQDSNVTILSRKLQENNLTAELEIQAQYPALFVWLEPSVAPPYGAKFSDNGFHMLAPYKMVTFNSDKPLSETVVDSIEVQYLKKYN